MIRDQRVVLNSDEHFADSRQRRVHVRQRSRERGIGCGCGISELPRKRILEDFSCDLTLARKVLDRCHCHVRLTFDFSKVFRDDRATGDTSISEAIKIFCCGPTLGCDIAKDVTNLHVSCASHGCCTSHSLESRRHLVAGFNTTGTKDSSYSSGLIQ